jgi:hypothetical protein
MNDSPISTPSPRRLAVAVLCHMTTGWNLPKLWPALEFPD